MFQDIGPYGFDNQYVQKEPQASDYLLCFDEGKVLLGLQNDEYTLPTCRPLLQKQAEEGAEDAALQYLFSVDDTGFFLFQEPLELEGFTLYDARTLMELQPPWLAFAAATALHLADWYNSHRFCGKCASPTRHGHDERSLICLNCGRVEYPKIAPVVIVGITDGDKLLLTKYAGGPYQKHALVAGFVEIGETLEAAAQREVLEEVGLRIKNLRYYKSQPWAFSGSLLMGFFADVDGDTTVDLTDNELSEAHWYNRDDIVIDDTRLSITWDMIIAFKNGEAS